MTLILLEYYEVYENRDDLSFAGQFFCEKSGWKPHKWYCAVIHWQAAIRSWKESPESQISYFLTAMAKLNS